MGATAGALAAADTVTPAAAGVVTVDAESESLSIGTGAAAGAPDPGELAAMATAAIASAAAALPDEGVAGAASVGTRVTAIATASGFGVVTDGASCGAEAAEESSPDARSAAEAVSEGTFESADFFSVGFALPAFKSPGFTPDS